MNRRSDRGVGTGVVGRRSGLAGRDAVSDDEIHVLLVDDDERWARYMAGEIEDHDDEFRVTVTLGANEAMLTLQDGSDFDCLVADYRMPEVDGLQLLERVREEDTGLPFVLVTGEGSEGVASRAIEAGVSDYLVKDPRSDQASLFVDRIRTVVDQHRLQRAIEESEDRYRTVTERSQDAVAIVRDDDLLFWNRRLCDLTGLTDDALATAGFAADLIHEHDRDRVRELLLGWHEGDEGGIHEARVVTGDDVRHCEITGGHVRYDDRRAALLSIRDVTEYRRRERELEWERELNRTVGNALIESRTREQLERAVTRQLCSHGYAMAWVGELSDGRLVPRAVHAADDHDSPADGTRTYVDGLDLSTEGDAYTNEPAVWAVRTNEAKFVEDFETLFSTEWRDVALDCGFGGGAAVPLVYNDVAYGVLAVYHADPDRFDRTERNLLTELADTVAFAVHHIETETALASEQYVEVTVGIQGAEYYLTEVCEAAPFRGGTATVTVRGTVPRGDQGVVQYVTVEGAATDTVGELAAERDDVAEVSTIDEEGGRLRVRVSGATPEATLASRGIAVESTTVSADGARLTFELPAREDVRAVVDSLDERFGSASVRSVVERDRETRRESGTDLTDKQSAALQAAYHHGYFEKPRKNSATEIADALDVTHSTFLHHLRTAQQKVFERRYG